MEIWKDIKGYEGLYQVSNEGMVKALEKNVVGLGKNQYTKEHFLKPHIVIRFGKKRSQITLYNENGRKYPVLARVVWEAFNGEIPEGLQVNHIDEDPSNNCLGNLNLMTPKENSNYGTRNQRIGETFKKNGKCSKPVLQYKNDVLIAEFPSAKEAARQTGFPQGNISRCCNGGYYWNGKWWKINSVKGFTFKYKNDQPH